MKVSLYLVSIGVGLLVGILYALLKVRSPAPPAIALLGLLGMLVGEQLVPITARVFNGEPITLAWLAEECVPRVMGTEKPPSTNDSSSR